MYKAGNDIRNFVGRADQLVLVEVVMAHGSTPREEGTWMLVSGDKIFRTIGGGQLENMAVEKARALLNDDTTHEATEMQIPLGPHIGQCCGGTVRLSIKQLDKAGLDNCIIRYEKETAEYQSVYIFGAGHVGKALAQSLSPLPLKVILVDTRESELVSIPKGVESRLNALPEKEVRDAPPNSAFVVLTHDHALDFLIAREALARNDATYVGMIGSKTKRATFRNWLRRENGSETGMERLVCPIGKSQLYDKRPEVIAAMVTAEITQCLLSQIMEDTQVDQTLSAQKVSGGES